jgi:hypothetical protein
VKRQKDRKLVLPEIVTLWLILVHPDVAAADPATGTAGR